MHPGPFFVRAAACAGALRYNARMQRAKLLLVTGFFLLSQSAATAAGGAAGSKSVLPFRTDYPAAREEARKQKLPLFVEFSAPWCHTCRSMKAFVFTNEALGDEAAQFGWVHLDTELAANAAIKKKHGVRALPTYLVLDPESEQVILRWVGGASVAQFEKLLADARANFAGLQSPAKGGETPDALLAEADRLYGENRTEEAGALYEKAIAAAPADWPQYARAVEGLLVAWSLEEKCAPAMRLAREAEPRLARTSSAAVIASVGLDCAVALPDEDAGKAAAVAFFEDAARRAASDRSVPLADDDRSGVYISLLSSRQAAGDTTGAKAVAAEWSAFLDEAAQRAPTAAARAVFDPHRLSAYLEIGRPEKAVPMLEASERDFPEDYNPPARLAVALNALGRHDEALAASDRAIARGYGPRLLLLLRTRADILVAKGDPAAARAVLEDAIRRGEALPEGQRSDAMVESLRKKLEALDPPPGSDASPRP